VQPYQYQPSTVVAAKASPVPLIVGAIATGLAVLGLLTSTAMVAALTRAEQRYDVDGSLNFTPSTLLAVVDTVMGIGLLIAVALIVLRRDAGRSSAVWISASTLPWIILTVIAIATGTDEEVRRGGSWTGAAVVIGMAGGIIAVLALLAGMILLGIPPGRRWLAERTLAGSDPARPPRPLAGTRLRFLLSAVLGIVGALALVVMIPFTALGQESGTNVAMAVFAVLLALFVVLPEVLGLLGARLARQGRRGGATLARVGGGFASFGFPLFTVMTVFVAFASFSESEDQIAAAPLSPAAVLVVGALIFAASLGGLAFYVAGLAGLADPRTERHFRERRAAAPLRPGSAFAPQAAAMQFAPPPAPPPWQQSPPPAPPWSG
jgi:hypothetical protein